MWRITEGETVGEAPPRGEGPARGEAGGEAGADEEAEFVGTAGVRRYVLGGTFGGAVTTICNQVNLC